MVKIGVQQPPAGLKPEKEKAKAAAGGDGAAGTVLLPSGAVSAGRAGGRRGPGRVPPVGAPLCAGSLPFSAEL